MPTCDMGRCWEFAEEIPGQSTHAFSSAAADNNVHLIAGRSTLLTVFVVILRCLKFDLSA